MQANVTENAEFRVSTYWKNFNKIPDMGLLKILTCYTDVGILSGTCICIYFNQALRWVATCVNLIGQTL